MCKKTHMKNWITALLICTMLLALCACGKKEDSESKKTKKAETVDNVEIDDEAEPDLEVVSSNEDVEMAEEIVEPSPEPTEEPKEKKPLSPEEIYTPVIDGYYADLVSEFPIDNYFPMTLGTFETTLSATDDEILNGVGYTIQDINGDGIQELLIIQVSDRGQTRYFGEKILALYTIANDEARFLAGGWARNRYYLLSDGQIYNEGSSGADDSSFETYILPEQSSMLEQIISEDSSSDDYELKCEEMGKLIEKIAITTFAEYETSEDYPQSAKTFWSAVYVAPAEETFATVGSDSYTASTSEYARDLVFFTPSEVSEFKFNSLKAVNSDNGELTFAEEELYSLDSLVMDKAVTITVEFPGDTPNYGISYKDAAGNIKRYAICESGFDGSIYLMRYENVQ